MTNTLIQCTVLITPMFATNYIPINAQFAATNQIVFNFGGEPIERIVEVQVVKIDKYEFLINGQKTTIFSENVIITNWQEKQKRIWTRVQ